MSLLYRRLCYIIERTPLGSSPSRFICDLKVEAGGGVQRYVVSKRRSDRLESLKIGGGGCLPFLAITFLDSWHYVRYIVIFGSQSIPR